MGTAGLVLLAGGGVSIVVHLVLYTWDRESHREIRWLIAIGAFASVALALLGLVLCLYDIATQGIALPRFQVEAPYVMTFGLFFVIAGWFWMRRGIFNKIAAVLLLYALLVASGIAPDPSRSAHPWLAFVLAGLIGLRWLSCL